MTEKTTMTVKITVPIFYDEDAGIVQRVIAKLDPLLQLTPEQFGELRDGSLYLILSDIEPDLTSLLDSLVDKEG